MFISEVCNENYSKQFIIKHSPWYLTHSNNTETVSINILVTFNLKLSPKALTFERSCTNFYLFICKVRFIDIIQAYIKRINAEGTLGISFAYFLFFLFAKLNLQTGKFILKTKMLKDFMNFICEFDWQSHSLNNQRSKHKTAVNTLIFLLGCFRLQLPWEQDADWKVAICTLN